MEARRRLVFEALRPAAVTDRWREVGPLPEEALAGLRRVDCPTPQAEALVIALLLREALEKSDCTAALVTPDRDLARRVAAELRRWNIEIDDSAGVPLNRTPPGVFLRLALDAVAEELAPVPLLALLKHPLAAGGRPPEEFRALARRLDMDVLRGPRPAKGMAGLEAALREAKLTRELGPFVASVGRALAPLIEAVARPATDLGYLAAAHVAAAEALARSDAETGAQRLWREPAGEATAQIMAELIEAAGDCPPLAGADYPALFEALVTGPVVRPAYGRHPRLFIWGLLEARLQHADRLVLGGLNEGTWPADAASDPWLSRPMRRAFGMPPPERRIGIAAHDFAQALGAREVYLTRAARVEGTPTVPSRWLMRLDAVLDAGGLKAKLGAESEALDWQGLIDQAERCPLVRPTPRPVVAARPRQLSVTAIETWMRDPYSIYARYVLHLKPLDPLDQKPSAADRGTYIHRALDAFLHAFPDALPSDALAKLLDQGRAAFGDALERPGVRAFWWPRFERIALWFVGKEGDRRALLAAIAAECTGRLDLAAPAGSFVLTARADRIDRLKTGGLGIIDFKTGSLPTTWEIDHGFAPQLPLEAAIAEAGGFKDVAAAAVTELALWQLTGRDDGGTVRSLGRDAELRRLIDEARAGLVALVAKFDDEATPYLSEPVPEAVPRYSDFRHLARVKEWSAAGEGDGEADE